MTSLRSLAFLPAFGALLDVAVSGALIRLLSRLAPSALNQGRRGDDLPGGAPAEVPGDLVRRPVGARHAGRDADPVVHRAAHPQRGQLGDLVADAGDPGEVAHRVLRQ